MLKYLPVLLLLAGIAGGCCTKKDCVIEGTPVLEIRLQHFDDADLLAGQTYYYDQATGALLDSTGIPLSDPQRINHKVHLRTGPYTPDQLFIVIRAAQHSDTIRDVRFESYNYKISCNECFLADGRETVTDYRTLSYTLNNQVVRGNNVVTISK